MQKNDKHEMKHFHFLVKKREFFCYFSPFLIDLNMYKNAFDCVAFCIPCLSVPPVSTFFLLLFLCSIIILPSIRVPLFCHCFMCHFLCYSLYRHRHHYCCFFSCISCIVNCIKFTLFHLMTRQKCKKWMCKIETNREVAARKKQNNKTNNRMSEEFCKN